LPTTRFQDDGRTIWAFIDEILVECPACGGCAHVLPKDPRHAGFSSPRRVTCLRCGYARVARDPRAKTKARPQWQKERQVNGQRRQVPTARYVPGAPCPARRGPVDTFLGLPLYLQTPCAGHIFWALNARHLAWLESFLAAGLREDATPVRRKTALSALPQWLILARHRDEALRAAARLRARLLA
jgi:hypothetical protein